ncbi:hypothetical protein IKA15_04955 [bacterium]|nr:hypothetical protein [bacterium]
MNLLILKRAGILSAILGVIIALCGLLPFLIVYTVLTLSFLAAPIVIIYMKKKKLMGWLDMQQSAIFGAYSGIATSLAFFVVFIPSVLILYFIGNITHLWNYYTYGLQYFITFRSLWLFVIIAIMVVGILALTNAVTSMGVNYIYNQIDKIPEGSNEPIDITIDDGV